MEVWACISQKGGAGKSTLAINLAVEASSRGRKALIVDLDPQGNALHWGERRTEATPDVAAESLASLPRVMRAAKAEGYDLVVLDTAPNADTAALNAAKAADLVLIPCRPSQFDLEAIATTIDLCEVAKCNSMVVINQAPPGRAAKDEDTADPAQIRSRVIREAVEAVQERGGFVCPVIIHQLVAFRHSTPSGNSAAEFEPGGKAAQEIASLYDLTILRSNTSTQSHSHSLAR